MLLELAGTRTHVVVDAPAGPASGPPVVLCSGLAGNWFDWDAVTALLAASRTVVRLDRPGYGLSDPPPDGAVPTLGAEVTRLRELLDALGLESAVLVAHSMASFYVEAFLREFPGRAAGSVLLDGSTEPSPRPVLPDGVRDGLLLRAAAAGAAIGMQRAGPAAHRLLAGGEPPADYSRILKSENYFRAAFLENGRYPCSRVTWRRYARAPRFRPVSRSRWRRPIRGAPRRGRCAGWAGSATWPNSCAPGTR